MAELITRFEQITSSWDSIEAATIALSMLTALLTYFTWALAKEARKTREQALEPNIIISIEPAKKAHHLAVLVIENVGTGPAYNIVISEKKNPIIKSLQKEYVLNNKAFMRLPILKPGQKINHVLSKFEDLPQEEFQFEINAEDTRGKKIRCANITDTSFYDDLLVVNYKTHDHQVRVLEKIERHISHILSDFKQLNVNIYDKADREEKEKQYKDEMDELYQLLPQTKANG